jgi:uncharacterized membrane protein
MFDAAVTGRASASKPVMPTVARHSSPKGSSMLSVKPRANVASAAAAFAIAAISMSAATPSFAQTQSPSAKVQCFGVNSCKGQSDCKSGNHDCKGQNSCKGQGFKALSASKCAAEHGSTTAPN